MNPKLLAFVIFVSLTSALKAKDHVENGKFSTLRDDRRLSQRCRKEVANILADPISTLKCKVFVLVNCQQFYLEHFLLLDSSTKIPEGIFSGRMYQLGDYDECLSIESINGLETVYGKYCLGNIRLKVMEELFVVYINNSHKETDPFFKFQPRDEDDNSTATDGLGISVAICMPSGCTPEEVTKSLGLQFITFNERYCYSKDTTEELTWGPIVAIVVFSTILSLVLVSTLYDIYLEYIDEKVPHLLLTAFSAYSNMRKLLKSSNNQNQLLCLNGIRAISMMWVIVGHQFSSSPQYGAIGNMADIETWIERASSMYIIGGRVSVDSFLVVGGLVTVYAFLRARERGVKFNVLLYYLHRYLRLTPVLAATVLFEGTLMRYVSNGPLWAKVDPNLGESCRKRWWPVLLYIQNYFLDDGNTCVPHAWYLSVDMQYFILSPLVLLPLTIWTNLTLSALCIITVAGIVVPFVLGWENNLIAIPVPTSDQAIDYARIYYIQAYARFAPYVIGMIVGYFVYKVKKGEIIFRINKILTMVLWTVCIAGMVACVYAGHSLLVSEYSRWSSCLYLAFNKPGWSLGLGLVILACVSGHGGPVDKFLSLSVFQFLTKVSYSMYLVHYLLLVVVYASLRYPLTFSEFTLMYIYWGTFMFSLFLGIVLTLTCESPVVVIEKVIFGDFGSGSGERQKKPADNKRIGV